MSKIRIFPECDFLVLLVICMPSLGCKCTEHYFGLSNQFFCENISLKPASFHSLEIDHIFVLLIWSPILNLARSWHRPSWVSTTTLFVILVALLIMIDLFCWKNNRMTLAISLTVKRVPPFKGSIKVLWNLCNYLIEVCYFLEHIEISVMLCSWHGFHGISFRIQF